VPSILLANIRRSLVRARGRGTLATTGTLAVVPGILVPLWLLGSEDPVRVGAALVCILAGATVVRFEMVRLPHLLGHASPGG